MRAIKESLGSESNQRILGGKEFGRAINESRRQSVGRAIKRVSAASNWPSAQEVLAGSIGQASMKSWLEAPAMQARKPSERTLAIVLSRTSNECCVPYHLRGLQLRPEGLVTKVADASGATVVTVPGRRAVDLTWVL